MRPRNPRSSQHSQVLRCCRAWPPFSPPLAQLEAPCYVDKLAARLRPGWLSAGGSFQRQVTPNGLRLSRAPSAASAALGRLHTPRLPHAHRRLGYCRDREPHHRCDLRAARCSHRSVRGLRLTRSGAVVTVCACIYASTRCPTRARSDEISVRCDPDRCRCAMYGKRSSAVAL